MYDIQGTLLTEDITPHASHIYHCISGIAHMLLLCYLYHTVHEKFRILYRFTRATHCYIFSIVFQRNVDRFSNLIKRASILRLRRDHCWKQLRAIRKQRRRYRSDILSVIGSVE